MADYTKNFQLKKPAQGDFYNVEDQNGNMDIIDEALQGNSVALDAHKTSEDHDGRYYTETEMDIKLGDKSDTGHIHDDRYYTESEINTKLDGKSNTNHGHSGMLVTGDVVDNCTSTATNKPLSAKQGKTLWDKIVDAVSALTTHKSSGDHDGRYYTENEINTKLGGKSDTSHNHDGSYVKKNSTAELGGIQVGNKISNGHGVIDFYQNGKCRFTMYAEDEHKLVIKPVNTIANGNSYKVDVQWSLTINGRIPIVTNDIVNNCTSADHTKILSAAQGKLLMDKINQLNSEKVAKSENPLYFRGTITGSLNRTNISPGYYNIGAIGSVSGTHEDSKVCWCSFIQFGDNYKTQIILDTGIHIRSYIGNPSAWTSWTTN